MGGLQAYPSVMPLNKLSMTRQRLGFREVCSRPFTGVPESLIPAASSSAENTPVSAPSLGGCSCPEIYRL
jgi:hypothetical protein